MPIPLAVAGAHRRHGIGRLLVEAVAAWARGQGASAVDLYVYRFDEDAIACETQGFTPVRVTMQLPLGDPQPGGGAV